MIVSIFFHNDIIHGRISYLCETNFFWFQRNIYLILRNTRKILYLTLILLNNYKYHISQKHYARYLKEKQYLCSPIMGERLRIPVDRRVNSSVFGRAPRFVNRCSVHELDYLRRVRPSLVVFVRIRELVKHVF